LPLLKFLKKIKHGDFSPFLAGLEDSTNRITHFEKWKRRKLLEDLHAKYLTDLIKGCEYLVGAFTRFELGKTHLFS
jgi:hypothetical protein